MKIEQFVMAYRADQDLLRSMLPAGFVSLRPVLRINAEIRGRSEYKPSAASVPSVYLEFNTPVEAFGKRGWLNIACWESPETDLHWKKDGPKTIFRSPFLEIAFTRTGAWGGCPAEKDNDGCFFLRTKPAVAENPAAEHGGQGAGGDQEFQGVGVFQNFQRVQDSGCSDVLGPAASFRPAEIISEKKEFCSCSFRWLFTENDAAGESADAESVPAFYTEPRRLYERQELSARTAAAIVCEQVLGAYAVTFDRIL